MVTPAPEPITFHVPPDLQHLRVPLKRFLDERPSINCLAVGAFVFTHRAAPPLAHVTPVSPLPDTHRAIYDFNGTSETEFTLVADQLVEVIEKDDTGKGSRY